MNKEIYYRKKYPFLNDSKKNHHPIVKWVVIFLISLCLYFLFFNSNNKSPDGKGITNYAYFFAKEYVKQNIKSPSTAKFPFADFKYSEESSNIFTITSYIDAQNSYGAMIRTNWSVKLKFNGGDDDDINNWKSIDIEID